MTGSAGLVGLVAALAFATSGPSASAQELSEKSVKSFMEYAWSLVPAQYSKQDGTVVVIDKKKKDEVLVPLDEAREVIKVGRVSAHAQFCNLPEDQVMNHRSLMLREIAKKKWSDQQMVYINQLHLTTVMLLNGKIKLVEKADGDKEVVIDSAKPDSDSTCTDEQRQKVKDVIATYVKAGPNVVAAPPAATGSNPEPPAAAAEKK